MWHIVKRILYIFFSVLLLVGCADESSAGITASTTETTSDSGFVQKLSILVTPDRNAECVQIPRESLAGIYDGDIMYFTFSNVEILIGDTYISLENAIQNGYITPEEIVAYARMDALNGFCREEFQSELGFTRFVYCYPEYEIHYSNDVFEASDGTQHLIKNFSFHPSGSYNHAGYDIYISDSKGEKVSLYAEDWGLKFETVNATPTGVTINCTQSGGIQIGQLVTSHFNILADNGKNEFIPCLTSSNDAYPHIVIQQNAESQFTLNWTDTHGQLLKGNYIIQLFIQEEYDPSTVPTLLKNYTDLQGYTLTFTIH